MTCYENERVVYLVEDEAIFRRMISRMLSDAGYRCVAFSSGADFFQQEMPKETCCLLLDMNLGLGMNGRDVQDEIQRRGWPVPVIFLSAYATVPLAVDAMKQGALNFLAKPPDENALLSVVTEGLRLGQQMQDDHRRQIRQKAVLSSLTPREVETLSWIITGSLNKQIAAELGITERTVKAHRTNLMQKLGVFSVAELVRFAEDCGIRPAQFTKSF